MQTRNVQSWEVTRIAQGWGNVTGIIVHAPRVSKKAFYQDRIQQSVPEFFDVTFPVSPRPTYWLRLPKHPHYEETRALAKHMNWISADGIGELPMLQMMTTAGELMFEHNPTCACGRMESDQSLPMVRMQSVHPKVRRRRKLVPKESRYRQVRDEDIQEAER